MAKITGIGGVFIYSDDPSEDSSWYKDKLGIQQDEHGISPFKWRHDDNPEKRAITEWSHIDRKSGYFKNSSSNMMINYRVDDLDEMLLELQEKGVEILGREDSEYGKFAWVNDNQGIRIELWQPPENNPDCY